MCNVIKRILLIILGVVFLLVLPGFFFYKIQRIFFYSEIPIGYIDNRGISNPTADVERYSSRDEEKKVELFLDSLFPICLYNLDIKYNHKKYIVDNNELTNLEMEPFFWFYSLTDDAKLIDKTPAEMIVSTTHKNIGKKEILNILNNFTIVNSSSYFIYDYSSTSKLLFSDAMRNNLTIVQNGWILVKIRLSLFSQISLIIAIFIGWWGICKVAWEVPIKYFINIFKKNNLNN